MITDWRGNVITVGATVVFPGRQGSFLWMNEGRVVSIEENGRIGIQRTEATRPGQNTTKTSYPDPDRLTVVRAR